MTASCTDPQFNWLFNSRGQSPCEIAHQLANACNTGDGGVTGVLQPNQQYPSLSPNDANPCTCNTVRYVMIVGCSACQSRSYLTFPQYTQSCKQTYNQQFPATIPAGTSVPHYAYLPLVDGQFNWSAAQQDHNPNESSGGAAPPPSTTKQTQAATTPNSPPQTTQNNPTQAQVTNNGNQNTLVTVPPQNTNAAGPTNASNTIPTKGSVSTITSNGVTTVVTYSNTLPTSAGSSQGASGTDAPQTNAASTSSGSSKAGPIAGGVVGGLAVICLFLAFLWLLRQRERRLRDELAALRPSPMMAQSRGFRDTEAAEPPPYMPSDAATIGSSELAPLRKPVHGGNTYQPSMSSGNHPGPSGHRPMLSEGGSSAALTGYASTGPYSGSD
jgi:hypothetical protein